MYLPYPTSSLPSRGSGPTSRLRVRLLCCSSWVLWDMPTGGSLILASAAQAHAMCLQIDAPEPSTPSRAFLIQPTHLASTLLLFWRVRASCVSGRRSGGLSPSSLCSNPLPVPFTGQTGREGSNQRECVRAVITPSAPPSRLSSCSVLYWMPLLCTQGCPSLGAEACVTVPLLLPGLCLRDAAAEQGLWRRWTSFDLEFRSGNYS